MIIAVTGGTGFIGRKLLSRLATENVHVRVLTRNVLAADSLRLSSNTILWQGDLTSSKSLAAFLDDVDVVFHCAGETSDPAKMYPLHVEGTQRLLEAAKGRIKHWVQLSSTGAYGSKRYGQVVETDIPNPIGPYETTKVKSDELVIRSAHEGNFSYTILRPSIVFGAGMPNQSLFAMMNAIKNKYFFYIGRSGASANYIHVDNVVHALLLCASSANSFGQIFNLSDHMRIETFVESIALLLNVKPPVFRFPEKFVRSAVFALQHFEAFPLTMSRVDALTNFVQYPVNHIINNLGYRHIVSMEDGIADLVIGYKDKFCKKIPSV